MEKKKMSQSTKIIIGLVAGILFGLLCNLVFSEGLYTGTKTYVLNPIGTIFLSGIKVSIVPLVMLSMICGVASLGDPKKLGRVGGRTIAFYLCTTIIAVVVGILLASIIRPGAGLAIVNEGTYEGKPGQSIIDMLVGMFPTNIIKSMTNETMLQLLVFSIIFGVGIIILGEKVSGLLKVLQQANEVMMKFIEIFMKLAPYAVFCLIAKTVGDLGLKAMIPLLKYLLCILIGCLFQLFFVYGGILRIWAKKSIFKFIKKFRFVMAFAFSTQSSTSTIPLNQDCLEKNIGVSRNITSFTIPFGATVNMDGTAILQGVAALFIAQYSGIPLSFGQLLTVVLTATLASIGAAGMPGTALIMLTAVCTSVGLPLDAIALLLGVDRLADMIRTTINITGDAVVSTVVAKLEGGDNFNEAVFDAVEDAE